MVSLCGSLTQESIALVCQSPLKIKILTSNGERERERQRIPFIHEPFLHREVASVLDLEKDSLVRGYVSAVTKVGVFLRCFDYLVP